MSGHRLDQYLFSKKLVSSRSQAENYIKLGYVRVDGNVVLKPSTIVKQKPVVTITADKMYVSRAALKLESVVSRLGIDFRNKVVLDVGSSTGGFTEYALCHGASKVIAVEVGKNQMATKLRMNTNIELHEQTDIRSLKRLSTNVDIVVIDVSFISIREVLSSILKLINDQCQVIAMVKPQFELLPGNKKHKGVIKNETIRRTIFKEFEIWTKQSYKIFGKADSEVTGEKGNKERFYLLRPLKTE